MASVAPPPLFCVLAVVSTVRSRTMGWGVVVVVVSVVVLWARWCCASAWMKSSMTDDAGAGFVAPDDAGNPVGIPIGIPVPGGTVGIPVETPVPGGSIGIPGGSVGIPVERPGILEIPVGIPVETNGMLGIFVGKPVFGGMPVGIPDDVGFGIPVVVVAKCVTDLWNTSA